jgi:hypothetical protein
MRSGPTPWINPFDRRADITNVSRDSTNRQEIGVITEPLSPRQIQIAQVLFGIAVAAFIGIRFIPAQFRQRVGIALTVCYVIGVAAFMVYVMVG